MNRGVSLWVGILVAASLLGSAWSAAAQAVPVDLFFVFDETGSIDATEFILERNFLLDMVSTGFFQQGNRAGVVLFAGSARLAVPLTANAAQFQSAVNALLRTGGGGTCIGCGLLAAQAQLDALSSAERQRTLLVLTDGANSVDPAGQTLAQVAQSVQDAGTEVFALGVGAFLLAELQLVASEPDAEHVSTAVGFTSLPALADPIALAIYGGFVDADGDAVDDLRDNCPALANPSQSDVEGDGIGDACDNCPRTLNADQADSGSLLASAPDGIGDACQRGDIDGDGDLDIVDDALLRRSLADLEPGFPAVIPAPEP
jgi:hypothetical protein